MISFLNAAKKEPTMTLNINEFRGETSESTTSPSPSSSDYIDPSLQYDAWEYRKLCSLKNKNKDKIQHKSQSAREYTPLKRTQGFYRGGKTSTSTKKNYLRTPKSSFSTIRSKKDHPTRKRKRIYSKFLKMSSSNTSMFASHEEDISSRSPSSSSSSSISLSTLDTVPALPLPLIQRQKNISPRNNKLRRDSLDLQKYQGFRKDRPVSLQRHRSHKNVCVPKDFMITSQSYRSSRTDDNKKRKKEKKEEKKKYKKQK